MCEVIEQYNNVISRKAREKNRSGGSAGVW